MTVLRVAVVHSFYSSGQPSGENEAVRDQVRALRSAGHEVAVMAAHTDELARGRLYPVRATATVATGRGRTPIAELRAFAPDLVHVHNLFPNFARGWVRAWNGPLVATLHNYRPLCAGATLYRAGAPCTSCLDGDRWAGVRHGCYRDSRLATAPLAWANRRGATGDPLLRRADRLVVLSELSRRMYLQAGIAADRIAMIPNFVDEPDLGTDGASDGRWVFAGRLSAEKGALDLLRRWPESEPLDIIGDGELLDRARATAPSSVRFLGRLDRAELRRRLPSYLGLVFPSRCLEGAPLVQVEALAAGLPILAFDGSSVAESVRSLGTGAAVGWEEPLPPVLADAAERFPALRAHCRRVFDTYFTEHAWLRQVERLYHDALGVSPLVR
ncbi:glycosyltransferase family 4 protein [Streptomyces sp. NPDC006482]|uniref:glycosyltransferase family 4 protein n=1 Tax=unclassified Streptomyces TaxID=2593676 RepID=UPI00225481C2|nr:glycosyltransferase family 4 protein [Streptomyces sp. NBC_00094]MCX5388861.1 glycosyltransferase family 4 protein [Streptomyces sp. NBC_00094]